MGEPAKCNQEEFEKSGTNGKCIEARELMIALPERFINYDNDYLLKRMADKFKEKYGVERFAALHHNSLCRVRENYFAAKTFYIQRWES